MHFISILTLNLNKKHIFLIQSKQQYTKIKNDFKENV